MNRIIYLNDQWVAEADAHLSIFDRATLFADAVYEVTCVLEGKLLDFEWHVMRLQNSLAGLKINFAVDIDHMLTLHHTIIEKNHICNGLVYLQVSRGASDRDFLYDNSTKPNFFMFTQPNVIDSALLPMKQLKLISWPEGRWHHRNIKTTQLLYSSLAKTAAHEKGADDVVYIEDGFITEASSSNFFMVDYNDRIITRPLDNTILPGITRARLLHLATENGIEVEERLFSLEEALGAKELFISSASNFITPIVSLDDHAMGLGFLSPVTEHLRALYLAHVPRF